MSPTDDPLDPLDAAASALVDGEPVPDGTVDPAAPELAARVAAFRRVAAAVAVPPEVDEARREQSIAAALAAWDGDALAARRAARVTWIRPLGIAAAVVAAVAIGGAALGGLGGGDDDDDAATASADTSAAAESAADFDDGGGSGRASVDDSGADEESLGVMAVYALGDFVSLDDLVAVAESNAARSGGGDAATTGAPATTTVPAGGSQTNPPPQPTIASAPAVACPQPAGVVVFVGTAELEDRPVEVYVTDTDDGRRETVVLDAADCSVVDG